MGKVKWAERAARQPEIKIDETVKNHTSHRKTGRENKKSGQ
jgi:hypothetical protein